MRFVAGWVSAIALYLCGGGCAGLLDRVGVMGDSLSSEYVGGLSTISIFGQSYRPYMSWVEQLVDDRNVNFGPYGNWGSNVNQGYRYNFASVYSVDTGWLLGQGQHTGLASQSPTLAVLEVGANDFFFHAQRHALPTVLFSGSLYDGQNPMVIVAGMLSRYRLALETVAGTAANPNSTQMVLCTVPDITRTPVGSFLEPAFYPGTVAQYRAAIDVFNDGVRQMAVDRGFAVLDMHTLFDEFLGPIGDPITSARIAGIDFLYGLQSDKPEYDLFLHDGFHPGTVIHGLIANEFVRTVNQRYGMSIVPLSGSEIVINAGLVPVPESSVLVLVGVSVTAACLARWARGGRPRAATSV